MNSFSISNVFMLVNLSDKIKYLGIEKIFESAYPGKILESFRAEWIRELAGDRSGKSPASDRGKIIHMSWHAHCTAPMDNYTRVYIFFKSFPIFLVLCPEFGKQMIFKGDKYIFGWTLLKSIKLNEQNVQFFLFFILLDFLKYPPPLLPPLLLHCKLPNVTESYKHSVSPHSRF